MDNKQILERLAEQVGLALAEAAMVYGPAAKRLALSELMALWDLVAEGKMDEVKKALQAKMTPAELANEKEALVGVTERMASDNAEKRKIAKAFLANAVKAAITVLAAGAWL